MGIFNKDTFMDTPVAKPNATVKVNIPPGVYEVIVTEVDVMNGEKGGRDWAMLKLKMDVQDDSLKLHLKRDRLVVHYDFFIDLTELGTVDEDETKNIALGRARKACGLNDRTDFTPRMFVGQRCLASIVNKTIKDSPDNDMRDEVIGVAAIA